MRKLSEQSSNTAHFLLTCSLGGGTGAGLGSIVAAALRDSFPARFILVAGTAGAAYGAVPCQALNAVLAGSVMQVCTNTWSNAVTSLLPVCFVACSPCHLLARKCAHLLFAFPPVRNACVQADTRFARIAKTVTSHRTTMHSLQESADCVLLQLPAHTGGQGARLHQEAVMSASDSHISQFPQCGSPVSEVSARSFNSCHQ